MYTAHRDHRFYYAIDVVEFIEERQCKTCIFKNQDNPEEMPMCLEISGSIVTEMPIEELIDQGEDGIHCSKYLPGPPTPPQVEGQETLF